MKKPNRSWPKTGNIHNGIYSSISKKEIFLNGKCVFRLCPKKKPKPIVSILSI